MNIWKICVYIAIIRFLHVGTCTSLINIVLGNSICDMKKNMCIVNYMYYMYKIYEIKANLYINSELSSIFNITNLHSTIDLCGPHRYFLDFLLHVCIIKTYLLQMET